MTSNPKVSVIMPVYNAERYLAQAIISILNQSLKDFQMIIIDDGSTDQSVRIIKSFSDPRIILIKNKRNLGVSKSLNRGLKKAKGQYVARMDADDWSFPRRFEIQTRFLDNNPKIGVVGSWVKVIGLLNGVWKYYQNPEQIKASLIFSTSLAHPTAMIRKKFLDKYNLKYNEKFPYGQDYEFWIRCQNHFDVANISQVLLIYRRHPSQWGSRNFDRRSKITEELREKQLSKAGINFSREEANLHNNIAINHFEHNLKFMVSTELWLTKIWTANLVSQYFSSSALAEILDNYWYLVCLSCANLGWVAKKRYLASSLSQRSPHYLRHLIIVCLKF